MRAGETSKVLELSSSSMQIPFLEQLEIQLDTIMLCDDGQLRRQLKGLAQSKTPYSPERLAKLKAAIHASAARREQRRQQAPQVRFDPALPITAKADEIVALLQTYQVLIVAGETGSGKTTQLPKLCLAAGRGIAGMIGCTQPRRIAARSVARRVAEELNSAPGQSVGFQVRFTEQVSPGTYIKFMTDGILLAETQSDPWLYAYDTLIIDEAHERNLNIDFLLGYLKRVLHKRPDLKLIVTSATIDTERFAAHFHAAPVLEIEGRGYPVSVRYRPPDEDSEPGLQESLIRAVDEINAEDRHGDILIFLAGEREIRDAHRVLEERKYRETEVLPLYARLSHTDQDRVFKPGLKRRIVLATNVAETSLTVPRIKYVIDTGTARVKRYSPRSQLDRLHIEPISQAAADQRKGRCGRVAAGVCIRLYGEEDFAARPRYSVPEILRCSLAGVILRMLSLKLGDVEKFPFVEAPQARAIGDGYRKLMELGALDEHRRLTENGRTLARLPIDVALGRMLIEARRLGALRELLVLSAFLSIADPRERPTQARAQADAAHAEFIDRSSDFVGILNVWNAYSLAHEDLTQAKLRDWCRARFLSYMRMREWRELHRQLLLTTTDMGWQQNQTAAGFESVHRCLLSGWPTQVARRNELGHYLGARQRRYQIFPGSALIKNAPLWLLSGQLLDTQRVYALNNAKIEPLWIESQAAHLVKRTWRDPHWERKQGAVMAFEQVTLFGLTLVERRRIRFADQDANLARSVFIREALVACAIDCRADFVAANARVLKQAGDLEEQQRRRALLKSDVELCAFFESRFPLGITTSAALDHWYRQAKPTEQAALHWSLDDVLVPGAGKPTNAFPPALDIGGTALRLEYHFIPNDPCDGVTLRVPLALLNTLNDAQLDWLVPGMLEEKVAALIRALPKALRRNFVPAPDFARAFCEAVRPVAEPLVEVLATYLRRVTGVSIQAQAWDGIELEPHLRMNIRLLDGEGATLAQGRDLSTFKREYAERARGAFSLAANAALARDEVQAFDFDEIPLTLTGAGGLQTFPALVDLGETVALRVFESVADAQLQHRGGVARLLRRALIDRIKQARKQLPLAPVLALHYSALGSVETLRVDLVEAALLRCFAEQDLAKIRQREAFARAQQTVGQALFPYAIERLRLVEAVIAAQTELKPWLEPPLLGFARANYEDLQEQLSELLHCGFVREIDDARLANYPRYLRGMRLRAERLRADPVRDQARMLTVASFWREFLKRRAQNSDAQPALTEFRWLIEELRISLFAQELGTPEPVSPKRLQKLLETLR